MTYHEYLKKLPGYTLYPRSGVETGNAVYFLVRCDRDGLKYLIVHGATDGFDGTPYDAGSGLVCPLSAANAAALRIRLPWLIPAPLGLQTSVGCGDRLGVATPGHIRAVREAEGVAPILAQQSIRENARTGRTPQQVVDDAMWGVFQEGWRQAWGADADHLKTTDDVELCVKAGYTFYTVDPGDHVDNEAHTEAMETLQGKFAALPWDALDDSPAAMHGRYVNRHFALEGVDLQFDDLALTRAAAKYGRAIAHSARMSRHLASLTDKYELEISVDETETPTSPEEHFFFANELLRLGVRWVSLAPRYVGRFEKGVEYIGDLSEFRASLAQHAAIATALGPYKLSIHSGSDKFAIYDDFAALTHGVVHLKTAGTSYLEALRAVAKTDPALFDQILAFSASRYETDRATYHVSAQLDRVPKLDGGDLSALLDQFDARQVLHVTFGSVLGQFGEQINVALRSDEETYYQLLQDHFRRHLAPFAA